jgi:hypothetical protein
MPISRSKPASEPKRNSSAPTSTPKKSRVRANPKDYPSYTQRPTGNPLTYTNSLTNKGLALKRLGLTEKDVADVPEITPTVKEAMGSVKEAIALLRGDDSKDSRAFIAKWDSLSARDQRLGAPLEHVITAAGLTTRRFMELLAGASFEHSATVNKIFVSQSQLKVMKSTVKAATAAKGDVKAMEIFHKITGAMPTPKGGTFVFNPQINPPPPDANQPKTPLQAMDSFLLELDDVRRPKQLAAFVEPIIPVEMPENAPEIEYLSVEE